MRFHMLKKSRETQEKHWKTMESSAVEWKTMFCENGLLCLWLIQVFLYESQQHAPSWREAHAFNNAFHFYLQWVACEEPYKRWLMFQWWSQFHVSSSELNLYSMLWQKQFNYRQPFSVPYINSFNYLTAAFSLITLEPTTKWSTLF